MINSRILLSAASIAAAGALMVGATFAFFSSTATSTGNVFAAGTFDLRLTDDNQGPADTVDTTWNSSNMAPGTNPVTASLKFRNTGTIAGDHVHFKAANTVTDNGTGESIGAMDSLLEITAATYDTDGDGVGLPPANILASIPDTNGNGWKDLDDLESLSDGMQLGALTDISVDHTLSMTVQLKSTADNTYQGDSVGTVFTGTLHQDVSQ
jgi:predicted ribosomally synthesized peptide with SipW-like signal peptide